ncbi:hypothetical protein [Sulfitobacter sp. R18_1]|uniref:hypothetical protein n=1 Tax=Sulfitobacter sp. R18_1 TaxID=2821104 RepID=UPI001ADBD99A|nr:hypothetical protein [Sulfitobacter sp. R18_1]MBO9428073.1 hypothetical protein [Sulfitobacter sp. R18_1]
MSVKATEAELLSVPWIERLAHGDYTVEMASLPTRDGRNMGNAVQVGLVSGEGETPRYLVISDAGNPLTATLKQLKAAFHPPIVVLKDLLPAHVAALRTLKRKGENLKVDIEKLVEKMP